MNPFASAFLTGMLCLSVWTAGSQTTVGDTIKIQTAEVSAREVPPKETGEELRLAVLRFYPGLNAGELLAFSGENVQDYGIPGSVQLLRPRGLAAEYARFKWNGLTVNSPSLGLQDLSLIPALYLVQPEGYAGFGNYELNFDHRPLEEDVIRSWTSFTSLGNLESGLNLKTSRNQLSFKLDVFHRNLRNSFNYTDRLKPESSTDEQVHNDVSELQLIPFLSYTQNNHRVSAFAWLAEKELELPELLGSYALPDAVQNDENRRLGLAYSYVKEAFSAELTAGRVIDHQRFRDLRQEDGTYGLDSKISTFRTQIGAKLGYNRDRADYALHFSPEWWMAESENLLIPGHSELRWEGGVTTNGRFRQLLYQLDIGLTAADQAQPVSRLRLVQSLNPGSWTLEFSGIQERFFRWPTLNERYWQPGGNPDILPEQGWNSELGLSASSTKNTFRIKTGLEAWSTTVKNRILWKPENLIWSPLNVDRVSSQGFSVVSELAHTSFRTRVFLRLRYDYTLSLDARDFILPYSPVHRFTASSSVNFKSLELFSAFRSAGMRYSDFEMNEFTVLHPYQMLQAGLSWERKWNTLHARLSFSTENALDQQIEFIRLRPVPGRSYRLSLILSLHPKPKSS